MTVAVAVFLLLGFVFLARDATIAEGLRTWIHKGSDRSRMLRFIDRMLACAPCVAAWAAPPSVVLAWSLTVLHEYVAAVLLLFVVTPICGIGLLYGVTVLSPTQALAAFLENRRGKRS